MDDIAKLLRSRPLYEGHGEESDLPEMAADEIERLRAALRARDVHDGTGKRLSEMEGADPAPEADASDWRIECGKPTKEPQSDE